MRKLFSTLSPILIVAGALSANMVRSPVFAQASAQASAQRVQTGSAPATNSSKPSPLPQNKADNLSAGVVKTLTFFEPHGYAVRVFEENQQLKINLYDQRTRSLLLNGASVTQQSTSDRTIYLHQGEPTIRVLVAGDGTQQLYFGDTPVADGQPAITTNPDSQTNSDTTFRIDAASPAENRTLKSGPIQVTVSYTPPSTTRMDDADENLQYQVSYEGDQRPEATIKATAEAYSSASLLLRDLDSDGLSEVIVQNYSGGAHCCTNTAVYSWQNNKFTRIESGYLDGSGGSFEDLDSDGLSEFISADNRFLYLFSSYAGSFPPPLISTFKGGEFTETTRQYPALIREQIAQIEKTFADKNYEGERNGLLAGYVAMKSLVGEYDAGWAYMLAHYDAESEWGLEIRNEEGKETGSYPDFPTALAAFLNQTRYR